MKTIKRSSPWPRPSTLRFIREGLSLPGFSMLDWIHGYVYGRWPYLYIGTALGEHPLAKTLGPFVKWLVNHSASSGGTEKAGTSFADTYHGKVLTTRAAGRLISVGRDIELPDLEPVIPYARARDLILHHPDHIVALDCPCRSSRTEPCLPLDVCLIVGEPFAGFILEHHPEKSRPLTVQQAQDVLKAEHDRGHVHHAFFKDAMLDRFYAICNCCSCCCGAMQAQRNGLPMLCSSGYVARLDRESCMECLVCAELCPFDAIRTDAGHLLFDTATCMGCGVCVDSCPAQAITLERDPGRSSPLEIDRLMDQNP